jgi:signal transduction histidine kinase
MSGRVLSLLSRVARQLNSLRVQALLATILPLAILLGLAVAAVFLAYEQVAAQLALGRDRELARISADRLSENMAGFMRVLTTLANLDLMRSGDLGSQKEALSKAPDLLVDFDGGVIVLNAAGTVVITEPYRPDLLGESFSDVSYFRQVQQQRTFVFSDIVQEPGSGEDMIVVAVPITSRDGNTQGVLLGRFYVAFQRIGQEIQKLRISDVGEAYLIDHAGRVIYHPDFALIGTDVSQRVSVAQLMQGDREGAVIVEGAGAERQVVGYAIVGVTGWGLVVQEPWAEVVAPAVSSLRPIILVLLAGVVLLAAIVSTGVQRVIRPISQMAEYARKVAAGDYAVQVPPNPIRELRAMGDAFNEMVAQISRYQAGLRQYVAAITHTQEEERRRIARDLHDDTVQSLIAIGQRLELARDMIGDHPQEAVEQLRDLRKMITSTIDSVRQFSRDLRPTVLEDLGLVAALQFLVSDLSQKDKVEVALSIEGNADGLPPEMEVAIYRIVQEALTNIRKHACASLVQIRAQFLPKQVVVTVRDNGVGFEVPTEMADLANQGNFGLMGLKERTQLFEGHVSIISQPNQGTQVQVILPWTARVSAVLSSPPPPTSSFPARARPAEPSRASEQPR